MALITKQMLLTLLFRYINNKDFNILQCLQTNNTSWVYYINCKAGRCQNT